MFVGGSFVFAILWSIYKHSIQDGFTIAACVIAAFAVLASTAHFIMMKG